jgi:hypothetical protein
MRTRSRLAGHSPDPRLERALRRAVVLGAMLVLALPMARGSSAWLGSLPLWLLGMPLASWWALHRFALPRLAPLRDGAPRRRHRGAAQARRRPGPRQAVPGARAA